MISRDNYLDRLKAYKDNKLIKVITGLRRCGKSTLLELFKAYLLSVGVAEESIIHINLELMRYDDIRDYKALYSLITEQMPKNGRCYIFLDEVQQADKWEKAVNSINVEFDTDIYITGSNAFLLSSEISTLLSGRYVEIKMLPLSFKEFLSFNHLPSDWSMEDKFNQYIKFGSLPAVCSLPQDNTTVNDFLLGIYNTVIVKDVISRNKIKDVQLLEQIVRYVVSNTGNIVSAGKISGYLSSQSKGDNIKTDTVSNYLDMLEKAYIIYPVKRYDIKGKEQLKNLSKYYAVDTGIRNMLLGYSDTDLGHILETVVYLELIRRGYQVFTGKWQEAEVDFIAIKQDERRYYQVTLSMLDSNVKQRELAPLKAIADNYEKTVLSLDKTFISDNEGIKFVNVIDFLLS
ncbi:MAG: ATP-binding protein [Clostridia bacterium]|nr:ATP-binding protein [Clostridia bacterium]MBQ1934255.1 ATP-binding protein [Clostridia bacterium]MBQ5809737.1 ATP-binding protein [Clostridia bacterium]